MPFIEARICYVDTGRSVCDGLSLDGNSYFENISYTNSGTKRSGEIYVPEIGDTIIVNLGEDGETTLHKFYAGRKTTPDNLVTIPTRLGDLNLANDLLPGDRMIAGPDGAFLKLFRGALAGIGSSPLCQTIYIAIEGLVRTVCQNYELSSSGMRVYSLNDNGKIITRACFNSSDTEYAKGANKNSELESENFEYQIDISSDGFTLMAGELDATTHKRKNNFVLNIKQDGDSSLLIGQQILIDLYASGAFEFTLLDKDRNTIYSKSIVASGSGEAIVKEIIKGDYIRQIDGNYYEEITGMKNSKAKANTVSADIFDVSASVNKRTSGMNVDEVKKVPTTQITAK